jgi:putative glutamine amidotransferase
MARRPRIAITTRLELETQRFYLGRHYSEAVHAAGGIPVHLPLIPDKDYIREAIAGVEGILLPGSNTDVDPQYYGEEPNPRLGTVISEKDLTDRLVLDKVEENRLPLLAICYGMQALNVHRGGTLHQDIGSQVENSIKHEQGVPSNRNSHSLLVADTGFIAELDSVRSADTRLRVNSSHHQALKTLGRDLAATCWAPDGIIECVEDPRADRFCIGVQWHPEITASFDPLSREIFERFISACISNSAKTAGAD